MVIGPPHKWERSVSVNVELEALLFAALELELLDEFSVPASLLLLLLRLLILERPLEIDAEVLVSELLVLDKLVWLESALVKDELLLAEALPVRLEEVLLLDIPVRLLDDVPWFDDKLLLSVDWAALAAGGDVSSVLPAPPQAIRLLSKPIMTNHENL